MKNEPTLMEKIWDNLEVDERKCMIAMIDAENGPPKCKLFLEENFTKEFCLAVRKKVIELKRTLH